MNGPGAPELQDTWTLAARRRVGMRSSDDVVRWAADEVARGRDTPSLVALASLSPGADAGVVDELLDDLLREGALPTGDDGVFRRVAASLLAREIVAGTQELLPGSRRVATLGRREPAEPELLSLWALVSEWEDDVENRSGYELDLRAEVERIAAWSTLPPAGL